MKWKGRWYFIKPWKKFFSKLFSTWEKCVSLNCGNFCRTTRIGTLHLLEQVRQNFFRYQDSDHTQKTSKFRNERLLPLLNFEWTKNCVKEMTVYHFHASKNTRRISYCRKVLHLVKKVTKNNYISWKKWRSLCDSMN